MTQDKQSDNPAARPGSPKPDTREERLRAALRANLRRRKEQARSRSDAGPDEPDQAKT